MMEFKVTTTFNGREMRPGHLGKCLTESIKRDLHAAAMEDVKRRACRVRCRTHGQTACVTFRGTSRGFDCEVSGCCSELTDAVQKAIS